MRSAPRPLAIVLAASTVTLSLFGALGCDGDAASRADKKVNQQVTAAFTSENKLDGLKTAAANTDASPVAQARAKAALADQELADARAKMRQVEQNENQIATLEWELGQLGQSIQTSGKLIDAYRAYDASIVQKAAEAKELETQGKQIDVKAGQATVATFPGLQEIGAKIQELQGQLQQQKDQLAQVTQQRTQLLQQADQLTQQSEQAKGHQAVELYAKGADLRHQAALLTSKIDAANEQIARLNSDLAVQEGQQKVFQGLITAYKQDADTTVKGFQQVASQEAAQKQLIQDIYGQPAAANAPATQPASKPATILSKSAQLAEVVKQNEQLRDQVLAGLNSAVQHYDDARKQAEELRRKMDEKLGAPSAADAPERQAWEDMKKIANPSQYQLSRAVALQQLGMFYADQVESVGARMRLAAQLAVDLQPAGLKVPDEVQAKDADKQLKDLKQKVDEAFAEAVDQYKTVIEAPLAANTPLPNAARVNEILALYAWSRAQQEFGEAGKAKANRDAAVQLVKGAVDDNLTLPALPPDIAPAPKVATSQPAVGATPTSAPAGGPAAPKAQPTY